MEIGSFYGITAPQLILTGMNIGDFSRALGLFNNTNDCGRVKSLLLELNHLELFLNSAVQFDYEQPQDRKLRVKLNKSKDHYENGTEIPKSQLIPKEDIPRLEEELKTKPKVIQSTLKLANGKKQRLSDDEKKVITYFYNKIKTINIYKKRIKLDSFEEKEVFGGKLYEFLDASPNRLRGTVYKTLKDNVNNTTLLDSMFHTFKRDIQVLVDMIGADTHEDVNRHNIVIRRMTNSKSLVQPEPIVENLPSFITSKDEKELLYKLDAQKLLNHFSLNDLKVIINMYKQCKEFTVDYYNLKFGLDLDAEGYEKLFDDLCLYGLVGLNLQSISFFYNVLDGAFFTKQTARTIPKDSPLATVVLEISRLVDSRLSLGEDL